MLPILSGPLIVQLFWLVAIGVLFLGRWPGGRGPAWETGEADPVAVRAPRCARRRSKQVDPPERERRRSPTRRRRAPSASARSGASSREAHPALERGRVVPVTRHSAIRASSWLLAG